AGTRTCAGPEQKRSPRARTGERRGPCRSPVLARGRAGASGELPGEQCGSGGLPELWSAGVADDEQSGGVGGGGVQHTGEGQEKALESARGSGGDPASAGGVPERGWAAEALFRRTARQSVPLPGRLTDRFNRKPVHDPTWGCGSLLAGAKW